VRRSIPIQGCSGATSRGVEGLFLEPRPEGPTRVEYIGHNRKVYSLTTSDIEALMISGPVVLETRLVSSGP
jgi:hypothetical protein